MNVVSKSPVGCSYSVLVFAGFINFNFFSTITTYVRCSSAYLSVRKMILSVFSLVKTLATKLLINYAFLM